MCDGLCSEMYISRGFYTVDPTGEPEKELAREYRLQASEAENLGFQRHAASLRSLSDSYDREATLTINEHKAELRKIEK